MISIQFDGLTQCIDGLRSFEQKHLPFALARGYTKIASIAQDAAVKQMDFEIDRPTPFTKRAVAITPAKKSDFPDAWSMVYIKPIQAEYLKWSIAGGTRYPKKAAILIPKDVRLNKYGNLPKGRIKKALSSGFSGKVNDQSGVWERHGPGKRKLRLVASYHEQAQYGMTFDYYKVVFDSIEKSAGGVVLSSLQDAINQVF